MTDLVDVLRMNDEGCEWTNIRTEFLRKAADEIERLRAADADLTILRGKLRGTLSTTHDCTNRTDCALRKVVWHLRAIL